MNVLNLYAIKFWVERDNRVYSYRVEATDYKSALSMLKDDMLVEYMEISLTEKAVSKSMFFAKIVWSNAEEKGE
jgi:hypothetical protein